MIEDSLTLEQYVNAIKSGEFKPMNAHERLYHAIYYATQHQKIPKGLDVHLLKEIINRYLFPASLGYDVHKRMLILVGPPGSGKSTLLRFFKESLEDFSRTDEGAVFGIRDCPFREDPLLAVPEEIRHSLPVKVNGYLSPLNQLRLEQEWNGEWRQIPVKRVYISEASRQGIGTFFPGDPYSQDVSDLIGSVDYSKITEFGSQSDPRAYRYDGEFQVANRGLLELQEVFKCERRLLYPFLTLAEERSYKISRQAMHTVDEVVIGHTNEKELKKVIQSGEDLAILNRMIFIRVPYHLNIELETELYSTKLSNHDLEHMSYYALETLASALVLTRIKRSSQSVSLLEKLDSYKNDIVIKEFIDEGMTGLDPRYAFQVLSTICAKKLTLIHASDLLAELEDMINHDYRLQQQQKESYFQSIQLSKAVYQKQWIRLIKEVIEEEQNNELELIVQKYIKYPDDENNRLYQLLGFNKSNMEHVKQTWDSLAINVGSLSFKDMPEPFQDAVLDLYLIKKESNLSHWCTSWLFPILRGRNIIFDERLESQVLALLNEHLKQFF